MAEASEALTIDYDPTNDVLRVWTSPEPVDAIAVPGGVVTVLVSESLDRVVGMVFDSYLPNVKRRLAEAGVDPLPNEALLEIGRALLANVVPPMMEQCAPVAKDAVASWLNFVGRAPLPGQLD